MDDWKLKPAADIGLTAAERRRSEKRESGLVGTGAHLFWWLLVRVWLQHYHRLEIRGLERFPSRPPFVIAANHSSHLDALALAAPLPWRFRDRIFPIAAGDSFFETPGLSAFAAYALNALPVWRRNCGSHALDALRARLISEPCAYILFPEGTRARDGKISTFKAGLGLLIAGTGVPVVPCHLDGTFQALPPGHRFPRPVKITLRVGEPLRFDGVQNNREGWGEIARVTEAAVRGLAQFPIARGAEGR